VDRAKRNGKVRAARNTTILGALVKNPGIARFRRGLMQEDRLFCLVLMTGSAVKIRLRSGKDNFGNLRNYAGVSH